MPQHLELRRNLWYATLTIPPDVRPKLGKFKFFKSLETPDRRKALERAAPIIAGWRAQIRRERGESDAITTEALRWRQALADPSADAEHDEAVQIAAAVKADNIQDAHGEAIARKFMDIATGRATPSQAHFEEWVASLGHLKQKTHEQMTKDVRAVLTRFPLLQEIKHQTVKRWLDELAARQVSPSSRARIMSNARSYWRYLQSVEAVPSNAEPFAKHAAGAKPGKRSGAASWKPFEPAAVVALWRAAAAKDDQPLADLIMLGAHTGARIEELCSIKLEHLTSHHSFKIVDAKTSAGEREVPIHTMIRPLVRRLKGAATDGFLLSSLTKNKYGDRSNAIGKRFGRLKTSEGFGESQVFHSLRGTLVTLLENAGVSENLAADIVGHEKPRITYGLYSGGASLKVKAEAIERVSYPLQEGDNQATSLALENTA